MTLDSVYPHGGFDDEQREIAAVTLADLDLSSGTVRFPVSKPSSARCR